MIVSQQVRERLDPGGRSALIACTWRSGTRRLHVDFVAEVDVMRLDERPRRRSSKVQRQGSSGSASRMNSPNRKDVKMQAMVGTANLRV
ncbi:hypothetical protein [Streptomyces sp. NPDC058989]|uniref:hypothetical protein n=1 Tax=Streptomyces sp. NPDC058989 TaxID=3346686 RepID=UPI0036A59D9B